jgi:hypothetical protein
MTNLALLVHQLCDLRFDDQACLEVAHVVGIFNYLTRFADGFALQLDAGT